jgi:hypothetical protein
MLKTLKAPSEQKDEIKSVLLQTTDLRGTKEEQA